MRFVDAQQGAAVVCRDCPTSRMGKLMSAHLTRFSFNTGDASLSDKVFGPELCDCSICRFQQVSIPLKGRLETLPCTGLHYLLQSLKGSKQLLWVLAILSSELCQKLVMLRLYGRPDGTSSNTSCNATREPLAAGRPEGARRVY